MQFYLKGYKPGDPFIPGPRPTDHRPARWHSRRKPMLIVGCGPAGLVLAAQLAKFPEIRTVVIDRKDGPLEVGQADGVACRTVEMFEAFGMADRLIHEGFRSTRCPSGGPIPRTAARSPAPAASGMSKRAFRKCRT